jgi:hypothetical protein
MPALNDLRWLPFKVTDNAVLPLWQTAGVGRVQLWTPINGHSPDTCRAGNYVLAVRSLDGSDKIWAEQHYDLDPLMAQCLLNHYLKG